MRNSAKPTSSMFAPREAKPYHNLR
jgi:hypothetical protein